MFLAHRSSISTMLSRSKVDYAGERAEQLLDKMRELQAAGYANVEPDNITYASIIRCIRGTSSEVSAFEKLELMSRLQMERWPGV